MTFPHSRILSPNLGTSKSKTKTSVNTEVNINLQRAYSPGVTCDSSANPSCSDFQSSSPNGRSELPTPVLYPPASNFQEVAPVTVEREIPDIPPNDDTGQVAQLQDSVEFLKLVVRAYKDNTIFMNKYVVLTETDLSNMLQTLVHADEITIIYDDDFEASCCATNTKFAKISKIYIKKGDNTYNLKYNYTDIYSLFETYSISLKFVYKSTKSN